MALVPYSTRTPRMFGRGWDEESEAGHWHPRSDLIEKPDHYLIHVELPGLERDDISIDVEDNVLTVSGETKQEREEEERGYYERRYGSFARSFHLPRGIKNDEIDANFKNGLLTVTVPKPEQSISRRIEITE